MYGECDCCSNLDFDDVVVLLCRGGVWMKMTHQRKFFFNISFNVVGARTNVSFNLCSSDALLDSFVVDCMKGNVSILINNDIHDIHCIKSSAFRITYLCISKLLFVASLNLIWILEFQQNYLFAPKMIKFYSKVGSFLLKKNEKRAFSYS